MAHYAFLDENNLVVEVITGKDENEDGTNWEQYYGNLRGLTCRRTSYNTRHGEHIKGGVPFRKNYAGIGYSFDQALDAFIPPKLFESWVFNPDICDYEAPVPIPSETEPYRWDESVQDWVPLDLP